MAPIPEANRVAHEQDVELDQRDLDEQERQPERSEVSNGPPLQRRRGAPNAARAAPHGQRCDDQHE
jgi:hypothetical protein